MDQVREKLDTVDDTWARAGEIGVRIHGKNTLVLNRRKVTPTRLFQ
jgi:hypothetical protein